MAENYAARKDGKYVIVGITPDACFTPGVATPVPYPVTADLAPSSSTVDSVRFNGHPAFVYDQSFVPKTIGDAAGTNKGVVSGTVEGDCWSIEHSPDTYIGGHPLNRVNDLFAMNGKAPGGRGGPLSKRETWERRKALIAKGKQSSDPKVRAAAERLELNNTGVEKAKLADYVYEPRDPTKPMPKIPDGWTDISDDPKALAKYNLKPKDLKIAGNDGFRSRVYAPDKAVFGEDMSTSVVFRGTRMEKVADWKNNAQQGLGMNSEYYKKSVEVGTLIHRSGNPVDLVGHSLGGGMAAAASKSSGRPGWTYNAAGLNRGTVEKYGGKINTPKDTENIDAYQVKGEILTTIQEPGFIGTVSLIGGLGLAGAKAAGLWGGVVGSGVGIFLSVLPSAPGKKHEMEGGVGNPIDKHDIKQAINCIENEKTLDENILST